MKIKLKVVIECEVSTMIEVDGKEDLSYLRSRVHQFANDALRGGLKLETSGTGMVQAGELQYGGKAGGNITISIED